MVSKEPMSLRNASGRIIPHWGNRLVQVVSPFVRTGPERESVSPLLKDVDPVVWDKHGVGGEVEEEEG
eukprot:1622040-Karenia_brevis.AAC.1